MRFKPGDLVEFNGKRFIITDHHHGGDYWALEATKKGKPDQRRAPGHLPHRGTTLIKSGEPSLKPCPFCGESRPMGGDRRNGELWGLHAGRDSSSSFAVRCYTCRARVPRDVPDEWAPETECMDVEQSMAWMEADTLRKAVEAWNRRA